MNKALILTLYRANNVGAYLQAWGLMQFLQEQGCEVNFVDFRSQKEYLNRWKKIYRYLNIRDFMKLKFKVLNAKKYAEVQKLLPEIAMDNQTSFDYAMIGSDEVWNITSRHFVHHKAFFGHGLKAKKIIAYAPSGNGIKSETFRLILPEEHLECIHYLSARDKQTKVCAEEISGRKVELVMDPTLLVSQFDYKGLRPFCSHEKFILVYSYGIDSESIKAVKAFSRRLKLPLISVGNYNSWCSRNVVATPWEFLSYLQQATFVVTSTFHGTILSMKYNKAFISFAKDSQKVLDALEHYDLSERNASLNNDLDRLFDTPIDYDHVNAIIEADRKHSTEYLLNAMR
jgi:hypothetical protein